VRRVLVLMLLLTVAFIGCSEKANENSAKEENLPPPEVMALVYPKAQNVTANELSYTGRWQIVYEVDAPYPPMKLLEFLRSHMRDRGYFPDKMGEKGYWSWVEHLDTSKEEETYVRQYMAPWSTLSGDEVALVSLQYTRLGTAEFGDTLRCYVIFR